MKQLFQQPNNLKRVVTAPMFLWLVAVLIAAPLAASADAERVLGIWKTQPNDEGSYLHVEIHACENKLCGTILNAFRKGDELIEDYENKGKKMIWDMSLKSGTDLPSWGKGRIWAPDNDNTYKSGMVLNGGTLKVTGCIPIGWPCRTQTWSVVIP